ATVPAPAEFPVLGRCRRSVGCLGRARAAGSARRVLPARRRRGAAPGSTRRGRGPDAGRSGPGQRRGDLVVAQQEGRLVEALPSHPSRDLVVALARVARPAGGDDVAHGVPPAPRDGEDAVLLQRHAVGAAVRAPAPGSHERLPLVGREVVVGPLDPGPATAGVPGTSRHTHGTATVGTPPIPPGGWRTPSPKSRGFVALAANEPRDDEWDADRGEAGRVGRGSRGG